MFLLNMVPLFYFPVLLVIGICFDAVSTFLFGQILRSVKVDE